MDERNLHEYARAKHAEMVEAGLVFDRKMLRWNDIVAVGLRYDALGVDQDISRIHGGIDEALEVCVKARDQNIRWPISIVRTYSHIGHHDEFMKTPFFGPWQLIPGPDFQRVTDDFPRWMCADWMLAREPGLLQ